MNEQAYRQSISGWIRENRLELGWTQSDLARAIGVSAGSISNWESESGSGLLSAYSYDKLRLCFRAKGKAKLAEPSAPREVTAR